MLSWGGVSYERWHNVPSILPQTDTPFFRNFIYCKKIARSLSEELSQAVSKTASDVGIRYLQDFDFRCHKSGLLLGHVQSGKTAHMLGIISIAAEIGFEVFILLTSDMTKLQEQTFKRSVGSLSEFCVCNEQDDIRFLANDMQKPVLLVLKKNYRVLETWKNNLASSKFLQGRAIFIVDDEADAASLNTKVNKDEISTINQRIEDIKKLSNSSFYLQVTATPQALFLQELGTGFRPEFVYYFEPGQSYLGGEFFYSTSEPYGDFRVPPHIRITGEYELDDLKDENQELPNGMRDALLSFLVSSSNAIEKRKASSSNFLIHPSVRISDHDAIVGKIKESLNTLIQTLREGEDIESLLKEQWLDLHKTAPDLLSFESCCSFVGELLENEKINVVSINSGTSSENINFESGVNIVVGGNSLGRGVTFPNLQTTYYCRKAKLPQADTFWQHCRAFGYDRDRSTVRLFMPISLFKMFADLNATNNAMIEYIKNNKPNSLQLMYPKGINPTRKTVINKEIYQVVAGGVNYFSEYPTGQYTDQLDILLESKEGKSTILLETAKEIMSHCPSEEDRDWPINIYKGCLDVLNDSEVVLIVRRNRDIGKRTGTLLSPDDRRLGGEIQSKTVLTLYRINGTRDKGWEDKPLWMPNIKFPKDKFFHGLDD